MKRILSILLAALLGSTLAQSIYGSADVTARFYSALPTDGGQLVAEANASAVADVQADLSTARYVTLEAAGKSYAFAVASFDEARSQVRLAADAVLDARAEANATAEATLERVATALAGAFEGQSDLVLTARSDGSVATVTGVYAADHLEADSRVNAESATHAVLINEHGAFVLDVTVTGSHAGEVRVASNGNESVLVDVRSNLRFDVAAEANANADADASASDDDESDDDDVSVGIGVGFGS